MQRETNIYTNKAINNRREQIQGIKEKMEKVQRVGKLTGAIEAVANYKTIREDANKDVKNLKVTNDELNKTIDQQIALINFEKDKIGYNDFLKRSQLEKKITQLESQKKNSETFTKDSIERKEKDQEIVNQILKANYNQEEDLSGLEVEKGLTPSIPVQVEEPSFAEVPTAEVVETPFASSQNAGVYNTGANLEKVMANQKLVRIAREANQEKARREKDQELFGQIGNSLPLNPDNFAKIFPVEMLTEEILQPNNPDLIATPEPKETWVKGQLGKFLSLFGDKKEEPIPTKNLEVEVKSQTIEGLSTEVRIASLEKLAKDKPNEAKYYNILKNDLKNIPQEKIIKENPELIAKPVSKKLWINGIVKMFKKSENIVTDTRELERIKFDKKIKKIDNQILDLENRKTYTKKPVELGPIDTKINELQKERNIEEIQEKIREIDSNILSWLDTNKETTDPDKKNYIGQKIKELFDQKAKLQKSIETTNFDESVIID